MIKFRALSTSFPFHSLSLSLSSLFLPGIVYNCFEKKSALLNLLNLSLWLALESGTVLFSFALALVLRSPVFFARSRSLFPNSLFSTRTHLSLFLLSVQPVLRQILVPEDNLLPYGNSDFRHGLQGRTVQVRSIRRAQVGDDDRGRGDRKASVPGRDGRDREHELRGLLPADLVEPFREGDGGSEALFGEGLCLGCIEVGEGAVALDFFVPRKGARARKG